MTEERRREEKLVNECKGDWYRHSYCDICPLMSVIPHYDEESGEAWDEFRCIRIWEM